MALNRPLLSSPVKKLEMKTSFLDHPIAVLGRSVRFIPYTWPAAFGDQPLYWAGTRWYPCPYSCAFHPKSVHHWRDDCSQHVANYLWGESDELHDHCFHWGRRIGRRGYHSQYLFFQRQRTSSSGSKTFCDSAFHFMMILIAYFYLPEIIHYQKSDKYYFLYYTITQLVRVSFSHRCQALSIHFIFSTFLWNNGQWTIMDNGHGY